VLATVFPTMSPMPRDQKKGYNKRYYRKRQETEARTAGRGDKKILCSFRMYESLMGRLERLLLEGMAGKAAFPWKSRSTALNGLIIKGLEALKDDEPMIEEMLPYLRAQAQINGMRTQRQEAYSLLAVTRDEVSELLGIGAVVEAAQVYHVTIDAVHQMSQTVWSDHLLTELGKTFPELAKTEAQGVRLVKGRGQRK
jgi:hypothetical protein